MSGLVTLALRDSEMNTGGQDFGVDRYYTYIFGHLLACREMASDGKFPEIFTGGNFPYDVRASIFTCLFFSVISMFR
jgi:hypothetical protein